MTSGPRCKVVCSRDLRCREEGWSSILLAWQLEQPTKAPKIYRLNSWNFVSITCHSCAKQVRNSSLAVLHITQKGPTLSSKWRNSTSIPYHSKNHQGPLLYRVSKWVGIAHPRFLEPNHHNGERANPRFANARQSVIRNTTEEMNQPEVFSPTILQSSAQNNQTY